MMNRKEKINYLEHFCGECRFYDPNDQNSVFLDPEWGKCRPYKKSDRADASVHENARACSGFYPRKKSKTKKK